jgi:sodium-dependent dicarboxylate transporter 2/3/5
MFSLLWEEHYRIKNIIFYLPKLMFYKIFSNASFPYTVLFSMEGNQNNSNKYREVSINNSNANKDDNDNHSYGRRQKIGLILGPVLFLLIILMPRPHNMDIEAQKMAAIAAIMVTWWICESVPIPVTSLLPLVLMPILGLTSTTKAALPYANDIIFLYMGGFFIALAMQRWNLHKRIAMNIVKIIGFSPGRLILGFMIACAALSAFVSNTATAVMMMPIGLAVITHVIDEGKKEGIDRKIDFSPGEFNFGMNLMLGIAYSCSVGGVATIIGTPPNAILVGFLKQTYGYEITFTKWLLIGVPSALIIVPLIWLILLRMNPIKLKKIPGGRKIIEDQLKLLGKLNLGERWTAVIFLFTAFCWIFSGFFKNFFSNPAFFSDATIAMIGGILLFLIPVDLKRGIFLLNWEWAKNIPWGILILFGGGLSLAEGFATTKLDLWIGQQIMLLQHLPLLILIIGAVVLSVLLTETTSNTATAAMLMPILAAVGVAIGQNPLLLVIPAVIIDSCAFMLPVSTPPNAVVFGTGYVTIPQMVRNGVWCDIVCVVVVVILTYLVVVPFFGITLGELPSWVSTHMITN